MKLQSLACAMLLAVLIFFVCCKKDPTKNAKLPPATQEGKNTVGFTVDGEVWIPYYKCGLGNNPCGEILARYGSPAALPNGIDFGFGRRVEDRASSLIITSTQRATITTSGDKVDSVSVTYISNNGTYYGPFRNRPNKFLITKIDLANQIISGEFQFTLLEQNGSGKEITIKDGRFDLRFNACVCSN